MGFTYNNILESVIKIALLAFSFVLADWYLSRGKPVSSYKTLAKDKKMQEYRPSLLTQSILNVDEERKKEEKTVKIIFVVLVSAMLLTLFILFLIKLKII